MKLGLRASEWPLLLLKGKCLVNDVTEIGDFYTLCPTSLSGPALGVCVAELFRMLPLHSYLTWSDITGQIFMNLVKMTISDKAMFSVY